MLMCPRCDKRSNVIDSRPHLSGGVWRRRRCTHCDYRFTTIEVIKTVDAEIESDWLREFISART